MDTGPCGVLNKVLTNIYSSKYLQNPIFGCGLVDLTGSTYFSALESAVFPGEGSSSRHGILYQDFGHDNLSDNTSEKYDQILLTSITPLLLLLAFLRYGFLLLMKLGIIFHTTSAYIQVRVRVSQLYGRHWPLCRCMGHRNLLAMKQWMWTPNTFKRQICTACTAYMTKNLMPN